jgi:serine/threonine protein kinase
MPQAPDLSGCALDGRYELHAVIGEGTFGRVYRGRDRRLARPVAVKLIKPWWTEDPDWVQSFEREAQMLARVSDPGIVQIFDVGHAEQGLYYVSELVDGENLATRLRRGPCAPWYAAGVAEQVCRALARAHDQRVVHRDIKPANILIAQGGRVKIGDFGIARLAEGSTDGGAATIVGTPRYMAPEQARGRPTTPATDVYSVGVVLYEMLSGQPPFTDPSPIELALRHLQDDPAALPSSTPGPLAEITAQALAKQPGRRFTDGDEMAQALRRARQSAGRDARPVSRPSRERSLGPGPGRGPGGGRAPASAPAHRRPPVLVSGPVRPGSTPVSRATDTAGAIAVVRSAPRADDDTRALAEAATSARASGAGHPPPPGTRPAPRRSVRRNVNPAARRRSIAALMLVGLLTAAMALAATLIGSSAFVRVPRMVSLRRAAISTRAGQRHLRIRFSARHSWTPKGVAIAQRPVPGARVREGSTVAVVLSAGPPPATVPQVVGEPLTVAQSDLQRRGLRSTVTEVPAPASRPGVITAQSPALGSVVAQHTAVTLSVAETPRWRALTAFSGTGAGPSVAFRIQGRHWRVVTSMSYQGTCTFVIFCSGPSLTVAPLQRGSSWGFDLGEGTGQTHVMHSGTGLYRIEVTPGSDSARWSIAVQDDY